MWQTLMLKILFFFICGFISTTDALQTWLFCCSALLQSTQLRSLDLCCQHCPQLGKMSRYHFFLLFFSKPSVGNQLSHISNWGTNVFMFQTPVKELNLLCLFYPGGRRRSEPDEAELLRVSRKLVEDAVSRALQQYKQETFQNGGGPNSTALQLPSDEEDTATKTPANSATENRKWHHWTEPHRLKIQLPWDH